MGSTNLIWHVNPEWNWRLYAKDKRAGFDSSNFLLVFRPVGLVS